VERRRRAESKSGRLEPVRAFLSDVQHGNREPDWPQNCSKGSIGCWVRRRAKVWATKNTWPIVELLEHHAGWVVVSKPLRTRAIADAKTKSDMIDAATVAELLAADYLPTG